MINIVVIGHGGYAAGIRRNLNMLAGVPDYMHFLDLTPEEDLNILSNKLNDVLEKIGDEEVLYSCDLLGASPFRISAERCIKNPEKQMVVSGINTMAYVELAMPSELTLEELASRAVETTRDSVSKFPE